jgi:hypothetical protein
MHIACTPDAQSARRRNRESGFWYFARLVCIDHASLGLAEVCNVIPELIAPGPHQERSNQTILTMHPCSEGKNIKLMGRSQNRSKVVVDGHFESGSSDQSGRRPLSPQLPTKCTPSKIQILKSEETPEAIRRVGRPKFSDSSWGASGSAGGRPRYGKKMLRIIRRGTFASAADQVLPQQNTNLEIGGNPQQILCSPDPKSGVDQLGCRSRTSWAEFESDRV